MSKLDHNDIFGLIFLFIVFGIPALKSLIVGIIQAIKGQKEEDE